MYRFIRANAGDIAYESYFSCNESEHRIYPVGRFPQASAAYQRLWSAGQ